MPNLIVVDKPENWHLHGIDAEVVPARAYLAQGAYGDVRGIKVYNLCRSYRYQSTGYYVSLLAAARGHRPLPTVMTIQDMKLAGRIRTVSEDLDDLIQRSLAPLVSTAFTLSIYFGRNMAKRYDRLCRSLFNQFPAPLLRAHFVRSRKWQLQSITPIAAKDIPEHHRSFIRQSAVSTFFKKRSAGRRNGGHGRYDIAILYDPAEKLPPSGAGALRRFIRAAASLDMNAELITREEAGRILEYDALFIRETTGVHHHTYRLARRVMEEGLVVIDDPDSILKCSNKVYLAELLERHKVPTPKTLVIQRETLDRAYELLGVPAILKQPDSAFSQGVHKAADREAFYAIASRLLESSELIIGQEFMPTDYDWRIGVLDGRPLFACKYFMARKHWQIIHHDGSGRYSQGMAETLPLAAVPPRILRTAVRAAALIGRGLYGVDLKEQKSSWRVIEINDNPNIDAGCEDEGQEEKLYRDVMTVFLQRMERKRQAG